MKRHTVILSLAIMFGLFLALFFSSGQVYGQPLFAPIDTSFTYQGRLISGGIPANGTYDFTFALYDALSGGAQVGGTVTQSGVTVADGLFTVQLDFGAIFDGTALYLEIGVRPGSGGAYTTLVPRQALTATPYARYAAQVPWSGLIGVPPGFADGTDDGSTYTAGTGLDLSGGQFGLLDSYQLPQGCANGQISQWNGSAWVCANDSISTYTAGSGIGISGNVISAAYAGSGSTYGVASTLARSDHTHSSGASGPAGGDLTGTYPNPNIAANAVGSAEIADNSVDMADTRNWIGFNIGSANFLGGSGNSDINIWGTTFTPSADGICLVIVNAYISSGGSANSYPYPTLDVIVDRNGSISQDPYVDMPFAPSDASSSQPVSASNNYVWTVNAGQATRFGCQVTDPDGSWDGDELLRCRISYICQ